MVASSSVLSGDGTLKVAIDIKNTGKSDGEEVVQLYVSFPDSKVERPTKQLKGFKRVMIPAGTVQTVELELKAEDLAYWNSEKHQFVVEKGKIDLLVGNSSESIKLKKQIICQ
jgi:beta-glucosidase